MSRAELPPLRPGVGLRADQVYSRAGGRPRLADVYLPSGEGPHPAVIFLHGGGWRFGDRRLAPDLSRHFAESGYAMVSIDYRLSSEAIFPAAVIDTAAAVRWLRSHAADYAIDPQRIALLGSSAGGHLASLAGLAPEAFISDEWPGVSSHVAAVIDGYGPVNFARLDRQRDPEALPGSDPESAHLPPPRAMNDPEALECLFLGGTVDALPERAAAADPSARARPDAPPFLILHGSFDSAIPFAQSRELFEALDAVGADAELICVEGLGHGFLNRTDLDATGPREMTRWTSRANGGTRTARCRAEVWATIRAFLDHAIGR
ncbi:alpha/beta hydrolase [Salipiger mangrovisoli]|uniref:Alpha/beta hydrolase n=1 Tax=Salipiger mangrovisoli TaxID=2865933 RepID=A0ABR9X0V1_9RHOB|nr:alpha/beta hydrolase [Salipiger mangrovisoli]MBE9637182.1 alpha/beta hydrolase [Salipiger mangrovisoli]